MAVTALNLHSFSLTNHSSNVSLTSSFPIKPTTHFPSNFAITASLRSPKSFNLHVSPMKKPGLVRDLLIAQATEAVAPTTEEAASSQPKSPKKDKKLKYPRKVLDVYQILQTPIVTESAIKCIAKENTLLFTVDARADKKMIRDAVKNFFSVKIRKLNTSIRPDGTKKAYIMLSKEYNASDIAKRIGIFPSSN